MMGQKFRFIFTVREGLSVKIFLNLVIGSIAFYSLLVQQKMFIKSKRNHLDRAFPMSDIAACIQCPLLCVGSIETLKLCLAPFGCYPLEFPGAAWRWSCPSFLFPDCWRRGGLGLCGAGEQAVPHPGRGPQRASSRGWDEGGFSKGDDLPGVLVLLSEGLGLGREKWFCFHSWVSLFQFQAFVHSEFCCLLPPSSFFSSVFEILQVPFPRETCLSFPICFLDLFLFLFCLGVFFVG